MVVGLAWWIASAAAAPADVVVTCGHLFDAEAGVLRGLSTVVIDGDRVTRVEAGAPTIPARARIDLSSKTCLPGLIDLHVHLSFSGGRDAYVEGFRLNPADFALRASAAAKTTLEAGFTTVRDLGAADGVVLSVRDAVNKGWVVGPRIFAAGKAIATDGGHADPTNGTRRGLYPEPGPADGVISGPDEARAAVRERYQEGADWIKITATGGVLSVARSVDNPQFTAEELEALLSAAKDYGFRVAAHAHGKTGALRAVEAGVTTIEHGTWIDAEVMAAMRARGTWLIPTLLAGDWVTTKSKVPEWYPEVVRPKAALVGPKLLETFAAADRAGVRWAFGTDAGVFPHGMNAAELGLIVEAGVTPVRALQAATVWAAEVLDRSAELGALSAGHYADLIAVDGDPLKDVGALASVPFVMKGGVVYVDRREKP